jgi:asparagine synthase (glutamine-hydrolysing)
MSASERQPFKIHPLSPINPDFAGRAAVAERFSQFFFDSFKQLDSYETRQKLLSPAAFSHLGVISTKFGLAHQLAWRDPTMDRRVIEFCLSVPEGQYVRGGRERHLIRRAMAGIIPDKVLLNETVRGAQAADWTQRLEPVWTELKAEIAQIGMLAAEREYLDIAKIQRELERFSTLGDAAANDYSLRMLVRSLIFSRFLRQDGI